VGTGIGLMGGDGGEGEGEGDGGGGSLEILGAVQCTSVQLSAVNNAQLTQETTLELGGNPGKSGSGPECRGE
jgi:hypothetical protein